MRKGWVRLRGRSPAGPDAPADPASAASAAVALILPAGPDFSAAARLLRATKGAGAEVPGRVHVTVICPGDQDPSELSEAAAGRRNVSVLALENSPDPVAAVRSAAAAVDAPIVVVLTPPLDLLDGWLGPLVRALEDPDVRGAQPVLRRRDGALAAAGPVFGADGRPRPYLAGFPLEDAAVLGGRRVRALSGPVVALRREDLLAAPTSPGIGPALAWTDLTLNLGAARPGIFRVCPDASVVLRDGSAAPDAAELAAFGARWAGVVTADAESMWAAAGFDLLSYDDDQPRLRRRPGAQVREGVPQLRWAIKNPATALSWGERWGDTHFARRLAAALRRAGQHVVLDHRQAFARETGRYDDVELLLRGLTPHRSETGAIRLLWVISHPEEITAAEAAGHDRVFAASRTWAAERSARWSIPIEELLQATDPELFHPDRAPADTSAEAVFVGSAREGSRPLVAQALSAGLPLAVYGADWDGHLPDGVLRAPYLANEDVGAVYRAARVVLNDHWADMRAHGFLSNRLFDAVAAGARVITDEIPGLDGLFGRSVQVSRSPDDLARLVGAPCLDEVFGDDTERRAAAARVHAEHSFDIRAARLLQAALEVRASR